ncbi:YfcE family phosphodiesterase [bacterium]|nr:YfcE family phosphodiesterase [bacterium]
MRIGICSDSHDNLDNLERAMRAFQLRGIDALVHCGDFVAPFTIDTLKLAGCPVYGVYGNCDGERGGLKKRFAEMQWDIHTEPHIFELNGTRIVAMHHPEWVEAFAQADVDIIVHGHTHEHRIEHRPPWIINPGEIFGRLSTGPSVVLFNTEIGEPETIWLKEK